MYGGSTMITAKIIKVTKPVKKALDIPVQNKLTFKSGDVSLAELEKYLRAIAKYLKANDQEPTSVTFMIDRLINAEKDEHSLLTFEDISITALDADKPDSILVEKIREDIAENSTDVTDEDIQLAGEIELKLSEDHLDHEKPFDRHFDSVEETSTDDFTEETDEESDNDVASDFELPNDLVGDNEPQDIETAQGDSWDEEDADINLELESTDEGFNIDNNEQGALSNDEQIPANEQSVSNNDKNRNVIKTEFDFNDYIKANIKENKLVDFNRDNFSKSEFFKRFSLPENKEDLDNNDYLARKQYDYLAGLFKGSHLVDLQRSYLEDITKIETRLSEKLATHYTEVTDIEAINNEVDTALNEEHSEKVTVINEYLTKNQEQVDLECKNEIKTAESVAESQLNEAKIQYEAQVAQINSKLTTQTQEIEERYQVKIGAEVTKKQNELVAFDEQRRQSLFAERSSQAISELVQYKQKELLDSENQAQQLNQQQLKQYTQALSEIKEKYDQALPTIEANALKMREQDLLEKQLLEKQTQDDLVRHQEQLKREERLAEQESERQVPKHETPVVVVPGSNNNGDSTTSVLLKEYLRQSDEKVQKLETQLKQPKPKKWLVGTICSVALLTTIGSIGTTGYVLQQNRQGQIQAVQAQVKQIETNTQKQPTQKKSANNSTLDDLLAQRKYSKAAEQYQDDASMDKIANEMLKNEDSAALKAFNDKYGTKMGKLNQAILEGNKDDLKQAYQKLTDKQKDNLNTIQKLATKNI